MLLQEAAGLTYHIQTNDIFTSSWGINNLTILKAILYLYLYFKYNIIICSVVINTI